MRTCSICLQKTDIYTNAHKHYQFIDGKNYSLVCFTCFFVPKILKQTYNEDGSLKNNEEIEYSHKNIHTAQELYSAGSADSLKYAKKCVDSVKKLCLKPKKIKIPKRPKPIWNLA